jgi:hypothetical protein
VAGQTVRDGGLTRAVVMSLGVNVMGCEGGTDKLLRL